MKPTMKPKRPTRQNLIDMLVIINDHNETLLTYAMEETINEDAQDALWIEIDSRTPTVRER